MFVKYGILYVFSDLNGNSCFSILKIIFYTLCAGISNIKHKQQHSIKVF